MYQYHDGADFIGNGRVLSPVGPQLVEPHEGEPDRDGNVEGLCDSQPGASSVP